ncbi:hypothetical protein TBR22_A05100 [Luteitalea sp. TBR-22]|uniref:sensor histidine kinase n=1 Tax=Luteitalea sp. TBR-22 TaxID=2802971 RepID=UPI001AFA2961|nr:CHASE3 domain-containing protein [Luteitalea sp. TBR-22]BCS31310.1 hypothetical protein TBR22_A05100 [Luteitalea sp. TBR-22]
MRTYSILARALILVAVPGLVLVLLLLAFTSAQRRQAEAQAWSHHTRDVLDEAQRLLTQLSDAQTGIRGFIITRDGSFLEAYERGRSRLVPTVRRLGALTADNPVQHQRAQQLAQRVDEMSAHYAHVLEVVSRSSPGRDEERALVLRGKALMDRLRDEITVFRTEERQLDDLRRDTLAAADRRLSRVVVGGAGAALFVALALGVWFHRALAWRVDNLLATATTLAQGREAPPTPGVDDELRPVEDALHVMAASLAQRQRAAVSALADAVSLFSVAGTRHDVLDVATGRALALVDAGVAVCTLEQGTPPAQVVAAAQALPGRPAPITGSPFEWAAAHDVLHHGCAIHLDVASRAAHQPPQEVDRVLGPGDWIGVPLGDDRRTPIGVLQVAALPGRTFRADDLDVVGTLGQAASVALALARSRQRLEAANADLAATNRENELFIYSVSHDLRSPLVNLEGFSRELAAAADGLRTLLAQEDVPAPVRSRAAAILEDDVAAPVRFIRTAVGRLSGIIDGLLRLSRAGRVEYQPSPLSLAPLVSRIAESMQATLAETGGQVRVSALPVVHGDPLAIEQVFANLIGNAVAYARPGVPVRIDVAAEDDLASSDAFTVIRVSDNGRGIAEAHAEQAFQPLQRLHPGVGHGEGMGLAIVRRVVERHGGRVWLRSEVGAGTTFYVELPRAMEGDAHG